MLRSLALPGWGQFYNNEPVKGVLYGTCELSLLAALLYNHYEAENARDMFRDTGLQYWEDQYDTHSDLRRDFIWYTAGAWLIGMLDAYVDAYLFSFEAENRKFEGDAGFRAGMVLNF